MIEVCCIFMIMLLGNLLGYLLWNRHLDYLLLVMIYVGAKAKTPPFARGLR
jgi:UDP-N-acetylmuramyl pentapeptide phosphotransferase/UDP-N-acetylglucosamine-1-phosphate transferase